MWGAVQHNRTGERGLVALSAVARADHATAPDGEGLARVEGAEGSFKRPAPCAEEVRRLLRYDPDSGKLFWLIRPRDLCPNDAAWKTFNKTFAGKEAFKSRDGQGYLNGSIYDRKFFAHRVIWLLQTGAWPTGDIDHINGDRADNRWVNLRDVPHAVNGRNCFAWSSNTSGVTGVSWSKARRKWVASIRVDGLTRHLGHFETLEEAAAAREEANARYGFSARHGGAK